MLIFLICFFFVYSRVLLHSRCEKNRRNVKMHEKCIIQMKNGIFWEKKTYRSIFQPKHVIPRTAILPFDNFTFQIAFVKMCFFIMIVRVYVSRSFRSFPWPVYSNGTRTQNDFWREKKNVSHSHTSQCFCLHLIWFLFISLPARSLESASSSDSLFFSLSMPNVYSAYCWKYVCVYLCISAPFKNSCNSLIVYLKCISLVNF